MSDVKPETVEDLTRLSWVLEQATEGLRASVGRCVQELTKRKLFGHTIINNRGARTTCRLLYNGTVRVNGRELAELSREDLCLLVDELPSMAGAQVFAKEQELARVGNAQVKIEVLLKALSGVTHPCPALKSKPVGTSSAK